MSKKIKIVHSCPSWTCGPRSAHPKFGGGMIIGGIHSVTDRLLRIKQEFPDDLSSGHVWHEVAFPGVYAEFNSPLAIPIKMLKHGIKEGCLPQWSAFTAPAFGALPGVQNGSILSEDEKVRDRGRAGHTMAIEAALDFKAEGIGKGIVIWWPAFDSRLHRGPLSEMAADDAWECLAAFWMALLERYPEAVIHLEFKPSVPGQLDWIPTMLAATKFCSQVNQVLDRKAMVINLEWAHALIGGQTVYEATKLQIEAGLFSGFLHANSAELAMIRWSADGTVIFEGTPGDDADWAAGEGGDVRFKDQEEAVLGMINSGVNEIIFEHDIDPAGENPLECYARSRDNVERMLRAAS